MAMVRHEETTPKKTEKEILDRQAYNDDYLIEYRKTAHFICEQLTAQVRMLQNYTSTAKTDGARDGANSAIENAEDALGSFFNELMEMR